MNSKAAALATVLALLSLLGQGQGRITDAAVEHDNRPIILIAASFG